MSDPSTLDLLAPALGLGASGALLALRATDWRGRWGRWANPVAPAAVLSGFLGVAVGVHAIATGYSWVGIGASLLGLASVVGCLTACWTALQLRRSIQLLRRPHPVAVDATATPGAERAAGQWVVLAGRLQAGSELRSPGGVPCAFYDAELRRPDGASSAVLARERRAATSVVLVGERGRVEVRFSSRRAVAPVEGRPSRVQVENGALLDLLSWESVGALGAPALAIGRLERDARTGWRLVGPGGGAAAIVLPQERGAAERRWRAEQWRWVGTAVLLAALAVACLGSGLRAPISAAEAPLDLARPTAALAGAGAGR